MVLSRFWLVIFISSIVFVVVSLFSSNTYTIDYVLNGKKDDPILISEKMPILPIGLLIKYPLNSAQYIRNVDCPVLILHGTLDELVPINHAKKLAQIKGKLISIQNGKHSNLEGIDIFWLEIRQFLNFGM